MFIEFMMGLEFSVDVVVLQQHGTGPGVFRQNKVRLLKDFHGTERHVFQISYGRRYYI